MMRTDRYAGKTVLASMIIDETVSLKDTNVLYFYCRYDDPQRRTFVAMARSFLSQLLSNHDAIVAHLYETAASNGGSCITTRKSVEALLDVCLKEAGRTYFILDGLDECLEIEQKAIASWLCKYVERSSAEPEPSRCLFFSRFEETTKSLLSSLPTISVRPRDNQADIQTYCEGRAKDLRDAFKLTDKESEQIVKITCERAKGSKRLLPLNLDYEANTVSL